MLQEQEKSSLVVYLLEEEEKKTFDEFIDNLQNENDLENEQDKPKKDTAGIVYKLMKNMNYKDGKGLGKKKMT